MFPRFPATLVLKPADFRDLVAKALTNEMIQVSEYGYDARLLVTDIIGTNGEWKVTYEIEARKKK